MERHHRPQPHIQSYWVQRKSLTVRNGILERHWESADGAPEQGIRGNASVQCRGPIQKDRHRCSRALAKVRPSKPIPPGHYGLFYQVAGLAYAIQWQKHEFPTTFATSEYRGSYIVTRAVTLSPISYRRFCNSWEWARHSPHPCTRNRMAWSSATSKQSRSTYERLLHRTRGIGTQDYPSSSWLIGHPFTMLQAWPHLA
jgi:hypothetical protein